MFLHNAWYIAAWADELGAAPLARRILGEPLVLFRDPMGRVGALADRCCHRSAPLSLGKIVEGGLECGYHGLVFDGSGRCVAIPGQRLIPEDARVRFYPVCEKDQLLWVWMGDPARADRTKIVDFPFHNDPVRWPNKHDVYPIKGHYMLMVDNLMDLTHLGYLHARTVGGNPNTHVGAEMKTVRTPTGLKFTRWMRNSLPPPSYVRAAGFTGRVDRCQEFEFVAPSTILQWTGATEAGSAYADPQRDFRFQFRLFHGLTPESESSCFYFWSVANGYRQNDPEATEQLYQEIAPTFVEDRVMVEAQQARLSEFGEQGLVDIASD
ncbi:MAG TPA: aromatic ring-hydroxylating dioxygenase subunit alpha, partial [Stellaceae bacterium]|nr:aromatic ring-hydroxylating dioxygenase subunit alpha [Stellaceae bacterium]